ncbi:MAG: hypothetical protein DMG05_02175 [Acidobacteria bacterium]|nr:MAG: hypothetical protein DMG05_02175 [Acidobacteriota bacterium]
MNATAQQALSRIPNTRSDIKDLPGGSAILCGRPPQIQFKDLETVLNIGLSYNLLPLACRIEYIQATDCTVLAMIIVDVQKKDLACPDGKHAQTGTAKVFGRVRREKIVLDVFEGTLSAMSPGGLRESPAGDFLQFTMAVPLFPGTYGLEIATKDSEKGNVGTFYRTITVP